MPRDGEHLWSRGDGSTFEDDGIDDDGIEDDGICEKLECGGAEGSAADRAGAAVCVPP